MLICDTHADTLWKRSREPGATCDISIETMKNSPDTRIQALALFIEPGGMDTTPTIAQRELAALKEMKQEGWRQIREVEEARPGEGNFLLTIEGGEIFGDDPAKVEEYAALGARIAALTWNGENLLGYPAQSGSPEGLKPFGWEIVKRMHALHIAADISHLNERGAAELMDSGVPPMASHSCCKKLCDHFRNLTDDQLRTLIRCGGYVGVNFYARFLNVEGKADLDTVIDHIAHICELGGEKHVGLGSDFDGIDEYPTGLRTAGDVPALLNRMLQRGFDPKGVERVAGGNFAEYMKRI